MTQRLKPFNGELDDDTNAKLVPFDGKLDEPAGGGAVAGVAEAGLNILSSVPAALGGGFNYLATLAATGGDTDAAMAVKLGSEERINDVIQYEPRTEKGKKYTENFGKGMQKVIEKGGEAFPHMIGAIPLVGEDLVKTTDPEAMDAIGRAYTEMALNVVDPLIAIKGGKAVARAVENRRSAPPDLDAAISNIERQAQAEIQQIAEQVNRPTRQQGAADRGIPPSESRPQGELFSEDFAPTRPIPEEAQMEMFERPQDPNVMDYELTTSLPEGQPRKPDLEMPMVPDRLELVPKAEDMPVPVTPEAPKPIIEGNKPAEMQMAEQARMAEEARIAAEKEAAFTKAEQVKEVEYNKMEAQREVEFMNSISRIEEQSVARTAFLDRANLDFQEAVKGGDKTLMGAEHTMAMREALAQGDTIGALKSIINNHTDQGFRDLAKYLTEHMDDLKVKLHDESVIRAGERDVTGYYDPSTHTVGLSGLGATSPHTVLHEITHGLTSKFLNDRPNDVRAMGLKHLYNEVMKSKGADAFPGIVNIKEFIAEAFSNPEFQGFLKGVRMNNMSVWQRFKNAVKSILGIHGEKMVTAFDHAMDIGKQVIEAQQVNKDVLKEAGLSKKLVDLMATKPKDIQTNAEPIKNIPGLEHAVSDFAFYNKTPEEVIKLAMEAPDIPATRMEKFAQQMQAGALFEVLKTRNPVVKDTYEHVTRAFQEAAHMVKTKLTDPKTGIKAYMRDLSPSEKGAIHAIMMKFEGQKELSSHDLAAAGMNERQINYYNKQRELDNELFNMINERRTAQGMLPIDRRVAHIAGRFLGDFSRFVLDADGKIVGRISGNTKWELDRATKFMKERHPEYKYEDVKYNEIGKGRSAGDRFAGVMEAINFLERANPDTKVLMDSYRAFLQQDAVNYLNATRHAKDKVKDAGGIIGSEGHKAWKDVEKNAEEGMKAQLAYYEQAYQWMAMNKAVDRIKQVTANEEVMKSHPNAVKYSQDYVQHAMGRDQGAISDALNSILSSVGKITGLGHSNLLKVNNTVKHLMMQKFMGFLNIPFTVTQLMQPFQTQPALLRLLNNRGLEFSTLDGQLKATNTYMRAVIDPEGSSKLNAFEKEAMQYATEKGIFDVKMADHTKDINESRFKEGFDKLADINITAPEHLTRGMSFLFYSHILKDAGIPAKDIFSAAENMTNMTMVNYHPIERPMGYAKLGWMGDLASTLSRYKHNQWSQLAFYTREGVRGTSPKDYAPLATMLATSLAFGGVMGFFGFNEADAAYQLVTEKAGKPDTLVRHALELPELVSHGMFSNLGLDMTTRFSSANPIPDSVGAALVPYGKAVLDMADSTGRFVMDPFNEFKAKQAVKAWAPQSAAGLLENTLFTEKSANGKNLYVTPTDGPNVGKGRVERSDSDMTQRAFGFRDIRESKELQKNYSDNQLAKGRANLAEKVLQKAKYEILGTKMSDRELQQYLDKQARRYAELGQDPNAFINQLVAWSVDRKIPQSTQIRLRQAQGGFTGAFNFKEANR